MIGLGEDFLLEVPVAPEGLLSRLRARLAQKPRRMLGLIKTSDEWVGQVHGNDFTVWERRRHAVRAHGRVRGQRGGSRVEARIAVSRRSRILLVFFFALYTIGVVAALNLPAGMGISPGSLLLAGTAGLVTLVVFWISSLRQRAALRAFLTEVFRAPT